MMPHVLAVVAAIIVGFAPRVAPSQQPDGARRQAQEHLALLDQASRERRGPEGAQWQARIKSSEPDLEKSLDWLIDNGEGEQALRFADGMSVWWTAFGEWAHARQRLAQALAATGASSATAVRAKALYD